MVFKKVSALGGALVLALASLFTLAFTSQVQAVGTTLYWCEFSSNGNFNIASDWNTNSGCSSGTEEAPAAGSYYSLVFDNSHLNSAINVSNNISGLDITSITFQGNGSAGYDLSGDPIDLADGITDTGSSHVDNSISLDISLTGDQTFDSSSGDDILNFDNTINLGAYNLALTPNADSEILLDTFSGSGGLTFNGPSGGGATIFDLDNDDSSFSGPVTINSDVNVEDQSGNLGALGSGAITVNSGGSLYLDDSSTTATYPNALNLDGDGDAPNTYGSVVSCLGPSSCTSTDTTLKLTGNVTLSGDTEVANGAYTGSTPSSNATFDFTGDIAYNGNTLTAAADSNTPIDLPAPSVGSGGGGSGSSGSGSSKSITVPKAPDTGLALTSTNDTLPLIGASLIGLSLVLITFALSKKFGKNTLSRK